MKCPNCGNQIIHQIGPCYGILGAEHGTTGSSFWCHHCGTLINKCKGPKINDLKFSVPGNFGTFYQMEK